MKAFHIRYNAPGRCGSMKIICESEADIKSMLEKILGKKVNNFEAREISLFEINVSELFVGELCQLLSKYSIKEL